MRATGEDQNPGSLLLDGDLELFPMGTGRLRRLPVESFPHVYHLQFILEQLNLLLDSSAFLDTSQSAKDGRKTQIIGCELYLVEIDEDIV